MMKLISKSACIICLFLSQLLLIAPTVFAGNCLLPKPSSVTAANITSCQVTLSWNAVAGVSYYGVKFKKQSATDWSPVVNVAMSTAYTFSGLEPGVKYNFAVAAFCNNNKTSGYKSIKATTSYCAPPVISGIEVMPPAAAAISWSAGSCNTPFNQLRYRKSTELTWTYVFTGVNTTVTLQNLLTGTVYTCQAASCEDTTGKWSAPSSFQITGRPNILMIILDDARYDSYSCNGGPSFFHSPNIDRIAEEGINFRNSFCVQSYCIPSRGSIVTGLYPHKNGATNNSETIYDYLPTTAKILDSAGYYTGWIGKYHMAVKPQPGYDYWFATKVNSGIDEYNNLKYNYNGTLATIPGHDTDIVTDTTLAFLNRNADKNFFVTVGYHAPHNPFIPQQPFDGLFDGEAMPVPANTAHYKSNFPSFLYNLSEAYYIGQQEIASEYQPYYEMLAGLDVAIGKILDKLTQLNIIDNTLIIFTSDNGTMFGEHGLFLKRFAYEPSSRVPLFIRFPAWFPAATVIDSQLALNVDLAPTILEAAGIHDGYSFDGASLKDLVEGTVLRNSYYFESVYDPFTAALPSLRSVRTLHEKYIQYGCSHETAEFFNLSTDPAEDTNQVKNPLYAAAIGSLQLQLNNFKLELDDNAQEVVLNCFLKQGVQKYAEVSIPDPEDLPSIEDNVLIFPQPANQRITISFLSDENDDRAQCTVSDALGERVVQQYAAVISGQNNILMNIGALPPGYYLLTVDVNGKSITRPLLVAD
ncbi:MAG: sulfatase-like hydrolase/transferase [Chitinophagales bacterium]|nr:sulfatase-like hydrolase/transferase [Chitinophagales bacterium]